MLGTYLCRRTRKKSVVREYGAVSVCGTFLHCMLVRFWRFWPDLWIFDTEMTAVNTKAARKMYSLDHSSKESFPQSKKRRTLEDFNTFCSLVLAYEARGQEEFIRRNKSPNSLDSVSSSTDSAFSEAASSPNSSSDEHERLLDDVDEEYESGDESWDKVTCYCQKAFAGRPMIECSECLTWIHLSCAKIRKSNVPDVFVCQKCRDAKHTIRRSNRVRSQSKVRP